MFAVTILGNNSALPMHDRHPTSQVVSYDENLFLVDCGEGTQIQMNKFKIRRSRIKHIFISHLHGDHYFGLPGLLTSYGLNNRQEPLYLHAPEPLMEILDLQLKVASTQLPYELHFHPIPEKGGLLVNEKKIEVHAFPVIHRIPCWGFLFREKPKPRKLDMDRLIQYRIPSSFYPRLKAGDDYCLPDGTLIKNEEVTTPGPESLSYAFCADTIYTESFLDNIRGCTLLYHEATYLDSLRERAAERFHSTAKQAAELALKAETNQLLLGHFSSKYEGLDEFLSEAREVFPSTQLAIEGSCYSIS
jgi:ribonuclease Z